MCHGSSASDYFAVYPYRSAKPRVPWIMDLALFSIMGFVLTGCTIAAAHIWRWRKTARNPDRSSRQTLDGSSRFRKLVGCIIVMSGAPPEQTTSIRTTCRRVLISKLVVCSISVLALSARAGGPCLCPSEDQDRASTGRESVFPHIWSAIPALIQFARTTVYSVHGG